MRGPGQRLVDDRHRRRQARAVAAKNGVQIHHHVGCADDGADVGVVRLDGVRRLHDLIGRLQHGAVLADEHVGRGHARGRHRQLRVVHEHGGECRIGRLAHKRDGVRPSHFQRCDDVRLVRRRRVDHVPGDGQPPDVRQIVDVVVGEGPDRMSTRQRCVPQLLEPERPVDHLHQLIAGQAVQVAFAVGGSRMVDGDERRGRGDAVEDELLLVEPGPEREIEPLDLPGADRQLVFLADVVAVLVQRQGLHAVPGRDPVIVRDASHRVAALPIRRHYLVVGMRAVGEAAPRVPVRVQVGALPRSGEMRVRVPERRAAEGARGWKPVNWRERVGNGRGEEDDRRGAFENEHPRGILTDGMDRQYR